jgi:excisionase family DNA binding protein
VPETEPTVLTVPEAARILRISTAYAYALASRGELPSLRLGRRILVPRRALESLVDGRAGEENRALTNGRGSLRSIADGRPVS